MKSSKIFFIIIFVLLFIILFSCGQGANNADQNFSKLQYIRTVYGGCNGKAIQNISQFISEFKNDTVYYSINDDILKISIGMNYNCGAYFEVSRYVENQNLEITLNDTTFGTAKCICYYNFDIYFSGYNYNPYYLKIYLYKRGQATQDSLFADIIIE